MESNEIKMAARCDRQPSPKECSGGLFTKDAVYPAETREGSKQVMVLDDRRLVTVMDTEVFDRFFKRQDVELTPEMEKADHEQWQEIMKLAEKYGYISNAAGGTAILICHRVQLEECGFGEFVRIQEMNGIDRATLPYPFNGKPE